MAWRLSPPLWPPDCSCRLRAMASSTMRSSSASGGMSSIAWKLELPSSSASRALTWGDDCTSSSDGTSTIGSGGSWWQAKNVKFMNPSHELLPSNHMHQDTRMDAKHMKCILLNICRNSWPKCRWNILKILCVSYKAITTKLTN